MRRRRSARRKQNDSAGVASIVLLFVVAALFLYVFQALDIGGILFGDKPSPTASASEKATTPAAIKSSTPTPADSTSALPSSTAAAIADQTTEEIKVNALTLYGVQLGVFDKKENAQAAAQQLISSGASGYVLQDGSQFRVIDSVYYNQADAKTVRTQYKNGKATDASLLKVAVSGVTLKVKATPEQIATIRSTLVTMQGQVVVLIDMQKKAQAGQSSADDILSVVRSSAQKFKDIDVALTQAISPKDSPFIMHLHEALTEDAESLNALAQSGGDSMALLSGLKYNIIDILLKLEQKLKSA